MAFKEIRHTARQRATDRPGADREASGLIGYARVSTGGQSVQRQVDELRKAGCAEILEETASGANRSRPVLATLLRRIRRGETLVVVKLDRLARSLEHLLEVVRTLRWYPWFGQFGGLAKLGSGCYQAANFAVPVAQYASSGVRPASAECGRRVL